MLRTRCPTLRRRTSASTSTGASSTTPHGLRSVDEIGADNITYESDYPHSDSTWPHTREIAERQMANLDEETIRKIVRGNAIKLFGLDYLAP